MYCEGVYDAPVEVNGTSQMIKLSLASLQKTIIQYNWLKDWSYFRSCCCSSPATQWMLRSVTWLLEVDKYFLVVFYKAILKETPDLSIVTVEKEYYFKNVQS